MNKYQTMDMNELLKEQFMSVTYSAEWWDLFFVIQYRLFCIRWTDEYAAILVRQLRDDLITNSYCSENIPLALGFENLIQ